MEPTKMLAEFITSTNFEDLPIEVVNEAKLCFLDWFAVALAGINATEIDSVIEVAKLVGGNEQATVLGKKIKTSILNATLLNGLISHVLDFDDTSVEFLGHPSVTLFPCLLAVSEWQQRNGKEFLTAYVLGYEIGCRVGLGATTDHYIAGWHGTSTIGHFSAAAGAAKLLGLTTTQVINALGTAGTQASGLKAVFGTSCKPFHAGKAGFDGLLAALLAQRGFTSIENILEGEKCFWEVFSTKPRPRAAIKDLGKKWYILGNKYKFHASCYGTHAPIEVILALKRDYDLEPEIINKIEIQVAPETLEIAGKPSPSTGLEGKFSIPYTVANAFLRGDTGIPAFTDEKVNDPEIRALMDKIEMISNQNTPPFMSDMTIYTDGDKYQKKINILQQIMDIGGKKRELVKKFQSIAPSVLEESKIEVLIERIENLDQEQNMAELIELLN